MLRVVLALCLASCAFGQKAWIGPCPEVQVVPNFNLSSFLGTWYVQLEYYSLLGMAINCEKHEYSLNPDGTVTDVATASGFLINPKWTVTLTADPDNPAKLSARLPLAIFSTPTWILDTDDGASYASIWSCSDIIIADTSYGFVMTRDRNASDEVIAAGRNAFTRNNLNANFFKHDSQSNCSN